MNIGFIIWDSLNTLLVICRCSILCLIACFVEYKFLYFIPLAITLDWSIFQYSYQSVLKIQQTSLNKAIEKFKAQDINMERIYDNAIEEIDKEMRKYQLFKWGNKKGTKQTIVIRVNTLLGQYKCFPIYNGTSVVFVPKTFYSKAIKDRVLLAHEFAHSVSHDLMLIFRKHFYCSAIILPLIVLVTDVSIGIKIAVILLSGILSLLQFWPLAHNEIEANNHALEVIYKLYGKKEMQESAKYLLKVRTETLNKYINNKNYGLKYAIEKLQIDFLQKCVEHGALILQISPMNIWLSIVYYSIFVLAVYSCIPFMKGINLSWPMLIVTIVIFVLSYIVWKLNITRIWIKGKIIYSKIGL